MTRVRLCALDELSGDEARRFEVGGHRLAVAVINETVYAIADRCSHADYSLSEGDLYPEELELECPKHGSSFSLVTGEPQCLPATGNVAVYPASVEGQEVFVELP